jgi:hypothetical protein
MRRANVLIREIEELREAGSSQHATAAAPDRSRGRNIRKRRHLACKTAKVPTVFR